MAAVNNTTIAVIKTSQKSSQMTTSSSARQKKFHRHFTQVSKFPFGALQTFNSSCFN